MKTTVTRSIVLSRTNFQEADRIVTLLTPDQGKIRIMAKGVRRPKSKLAGGIELFGVGEITYMAGKRDLGTLISARLEQHFPHIVKDINRTMFGYELLRRINKITEEAVDEEYFGLLRASLTALNDQTISLELIDLWVSMQLLKLTGHTPNLTTDVKGHKLSSEEKYLFSFDDMAFAPAPAGKADARLIKVMRLSIGLSAPGLLVQIRDAGELVDEALRLVKGMTRLYLPS